MMKLPTPFSLLLLLGLSLSASRGRAQNRDSLWNVWQDETQADTTRLKAIHKLAWDGYLYSQPDSAFYFAQVEYNYAQSKGLKKQMAAARNTQGASFIYEATTPKPWCITKKAWH